MTLGSAAQTLAAQNTHAQLLETWKAIRPEGKTYFSTKAALAQAIVEATEDDLANEALTRILEPQAPTNDVRPSGPVPAQNVDADADADPDDATAQFDDLLNTARDRDEPKDTTELKAQVRIGGEFLGKQFHKDGPGHKTFRRAVHHDPVEGISWTKLKGNTYIVEWNDEAARYVVVSEA